MQIEIRLTQVLISYMYIFSSHVYFPVRYLFPLEFSSTLFMNEFIRRSRLVTKQNEKRKHKHAQHAQLTRIPVHTEVE